VAVVRRIELLLCLWRIHGVVSASAQAPSTSGKRALRTAQLLLLRGYLLMVSERHVLLELGCGVAVVATAYVLVVPLVESSCRRDVGLGGETTPGTLWPMVVAHNTVDWRRGIHTGLLLTRRPRDGEVAN